MGITVFRYTTPYSLVYWYPRLRITCFLLRHGILSKKRRYRSTKLYGVIHRNNLPFIFAAMQTIWLTHLTAFCVTISNTNSTKQYNKIYYLLPVPTATCHVQSVYTARRFTYRQVTVRHISYVAFTF